MDSAFRKRKRTSGHSFMDLEAELTDDETFTETSLDTTLCQAFLEQIGALWQVDEGSNWSIFFKPVPNFFSITFDKEVRCQLLPALSNLLLYQMQWSGIDVKKKRFPARGKSI